MSGSNDDMKKIARNNLLWDIFGWVVYGVTVVYILIGIGWAASRFMADVFSKVVGP